MKKTFAAGFLTIAVSVPFHASADTVLGGYIGAQVWDMGVEGGFAESENLATFGFEDQTNNSFYAALEHPIPLVPNIKLARTTLDTEGATSLSSSFSFGGEVFAVDTILDSVNDITAIDYILYYEVLDNDLVSVDVGVNVKELDGDFVVTDTSSTRSASDSFNGFVPMGYGRAAVGIPGTGIGAYVEGSFLSIDDNSIVDYQVALTYSFIETLALDLTVQAGYRSLELDIEDIDDIYADLQFDGAFVGVEFDF
ncbi:MAG: TIGR04219 family outer membrane beta-barrel protein [Pseudomonadota bacterium]